VKNAVPHLSALGILLLALPNWAVSQQLTFGGPTMGTHYRVSIAKVPVAVSKSELQPKIEKLLAEVDRQMSTYRPDSELSRFNQAPAGEWFPVSAATVEVVSAAQEISEKTQGALDVTVGPLVRLWHFGPDDASAKTRRRNFQPPSDDAIKTAKTAVGYRKLSVRADPPALRKEIDKLEVDLSSIAPGYTVDRMADILIDHGINNFTVEIGGEVRSSGTRPDGKPWRVAVERPLTDRRELLLAVPLIDSAIATAGDYRKFFEIGGRRYSHIIDPATARPVNHSLASVSVVAETCLEADGWDTTLLVLGPDRGYQCAEKHGLAALFVSHGDTGDAVRPTPAWQTRFNKGDGH
jgi:thiamine biosynthesis lipoprotein